MTWREMWSSRAQRDARRHAPRRRRERRTCPRARVSRGATGGRRAPPPPRRRRRRGSSRTHNRNGRRAGVVSVSAGS
eukprot:15694-Pelagococcus_subviridis.AAC.4